VRAAVAVLACSVLIVAAGCGAPIVVKRDAVAAQRQAVSNVLVTGDLSRRTLNLLYNRDLLSQYKRDPAGVIASLHADYVAGNVLPPYVVALAELSYRHATHGGGGPYYLAAALYAWAYLFPDDPKNAPARFTPRERLACDLYNRGLTRGLKRGDRVDLQPGSYPLPFGSLEIDADPSRYDWSGHQLYDFFPVAEITVEGFPTYYRWAGIGAPLAAKVVPNERDILAPRMRVPVTAVLKPDALARELPGGTVHARLEVHPGYGNQTVKIGELEVPLESEPTAAMGLGLAEADVWSREMSGFLRGSGIVPKETRLVSTRPYQRGLIPVVMVHGTGSSAARWIQLYNELDNDPRIHDHYQFWAFSYETGNPIIYSSMLLRQALVDAVAKLDPDGDDPALRRMIVMGHSQGGLLTKMTVVDSGDAFWSAVSKRPLAELKLSEENRELLQRTMFVKPLPFVRRVVFVATPHHGSYVAGNWLAHQVARLVSAPLEVTRLMGEVLTINREALAVEGIRGAPTAVDNMTPGNRFVKTLAQLPIAPGVAVNSIIAVDAEGPPQGKNDGVVEYDSAHIEPVESELVVRSPHSCQSNPHTIEEVRRILLKHLAEVDAGPRGAEAVVDR
jgi:pimeloyl-ACP methyl ester carboxylesterase